MFVYFSIETITTADRLVATLSWEISQLYNETYKTYTFRWMKGIVIVTTTLPTVPTQLQFNLLDTSIDP